MKKINIFKTAILALGVVLFASCSKNETYNIVVENVTVQFNSKEILETVVKPFAKRASVSASASEYQHKFPESYKAYFVSKETKGEYTAGQVVKVIDVTAGGNTITIPALNYDVYVTNYEKDGLWYTWNDAVQQLPQSSTELYLYGKNNINYSQVKEGTVELYNPYAGVMIENNRWINGAPKYYGDGKDYASVTGYYLLYIRGNNTNTQVPINIAGNPNNSYTLNRPIEANNIYEFKIDGSVEVITDGNLGIIVKPFEKVVREVIKL